ncbi:LysR substrate-binding domain-containing protein [Tropicimonas sediminicola]|uniref:DNA-binding transcriptional regulator, LysR family n=1 Tax=Tropicimonas sediminicola TaxID=1031541 RepID=A0A239D183_9RHOB|nr:LysR substrate-binding domain-containing protein [Tropicimonas sediminicola]SNS25631.1 DNA-binding transcriptional regulator, LysR family [Tropicimonas sediminicola]
MPKRLSLSQLRAVDRLGNFSLAARDIGVSQPSVSTRVQALESQYGVRLFHRNGHEVEATPLLKEILPSIRSVLAVTEDIETLLDDQHALNVGQLAIGYSTYQIAVPYISRYMKTYPDIRVEARAMASHDLLPELESGQLDVCFITAREIPSHLVGHEICEARIVLAVPRDHPYSGRASITWDEAVAYPLVQREKSSGTRRIFEASARLARVEPNTILGVGSWGSIVTMVKLGLGLGVAMDVEILPSDELVGVEIAGSGLRARQYAVCLPQMQSVRAVSRFLDLIPGRP